MGSTRFDFCGTAHALESQVFFTSENIGLPDGENFARDAQLEQDTNVFIRRRINRFTVPMK